MTFLMFWDKALPSYLQYFAIFHMFFNSYGGFYMLYTVDEVAKMLNMHTRTIRRYIEKGQLRAERIGGSWRISEEAFKEIFNAPELKEAVTKQLTRHSEDMLDLYVKGKHRLQQDNTVAMYVFVFSPQKEPWVLDKTAEFMAELNRLGQDTQYDFTMTGNEHSLFRLTLIAPNKVLLAMIKELEQHNNMK